MTPEQEDRAHDLANKILDELRAAPNANECRIVSEKYAKEFEALEKWLPVRAIHIVNLAEMKRREFSRAAQTVSTSRPRRRVERDQADQGTLFD